MKRIKTIKKILGLNIYILVNLFFFFFFFYLRFLSRFTGEGEGYLFNSFLLLPHASQTLRLQWGNYCKKLTSAYIAAGLKPGAIDFQAQVANH